MKLKTLLLLSSVIVVFSSCHKYKIDYPEPDLNEGVSIFPEEINGYMRQLYLIKNLEDKYLRGVKATYGDNFEISIAVINAYNPQGYEELDKNSLKQKLSKYFDKSYKKRYENYSKHKFIQQKNNTWIYEALNDEFHVIAWQNGLWLFVISAQKEDFDATVNKFKFISREEKYRFWKK